MSKRNSKVKNQHYVSAFYLRAFCDLGEKIQVFDKMSGRCFPTGVNNIAVEKYFYDIPQEWIGASGDVQVVEKALGQFEDRYKWFHSEALALKAGDVLGADLTSGLAHMVITQYMRTQVARSVSHEIQDKVARGLVDELVERNFPKAKHKLRPVVDRQVSGFDLARMFLDEGRMRRFMAGLLRKFWAVWLAFDTRRFITSDNPVSMAATSAMAAQGGIAPGALSGVEVAFPLSPTCVLTIGDPPPVRFANGLVAHADPERTERFNRMQVISARQYLFGQATDFEFAAQICNEDPTLRVPDIEMTKTNLVRTDSTTMMETVVVNRHLKLY